MELVAQLCVQQCKCSGTLLPISYLYMFSNSSTDASRVCVITVVQEVHLEKCGMTMKGKKVLGMYDVVTLRLCMYKACLKN